MFFGISHIYIPKCSYIRYIINILFVLYDSIQYGKTDITQYQNRSHVSIVMIQVKSRFQIKQPVYISCFMPKNFRDLHFVVGGKISFIEKSCAYQYQNKREILIPKRIGLINCDCQQKTR
jgi:hypothetical protein